MSAKIIAQLDTSGEDEIEITFSSASQSGVTGDDKMLVGKMVNIMAKAKGFPKIDKLETGVKKDS